MSESTASETKILREGESFAGKYRVCEFLGGGSFGEVYRVEHTILKRDLALKVLRPELGAEVELRRRFLREIRIALDFVHEGAAAIREAGEENGLLYYTMDLVRGQTLERLLETEGALDPTRAVYLVDHVLRCLQAAHDRGILHRDVKPANLMVEKGDAAERILVIDFGVARIFQDSSAKTTTASLVGSPAYLAPEWIRGNEPDPRADLYAVGCVLYEMVVGQPPFRASSARELIMAHLSQEPEVPSKLRRGLPREFDAVLLRALAKDPDERFESAERFRDALRSLVHKAPTLAMPQRNGRNGKARPRAHVGPYLAAPASGHGKGSPKARREGAEPPVREERRRVPLALLLVPIALVVGALLAGLDPSRWLSPGLDEEGTEAARSEDSNTPAEGMGIRLGGADDTSNVPESETGRDVEDVMNGGDAALVNEGRGEVSEEETPPAAEPEGPAVPAVAEVLEPFEIVPIAGSEGVEHPTRAERAMLRGKLDGVEEASLRVNDGDPVQVTEGSFSVPVELAREGKNEFELQAETPEGRAGRATFTLTRDTLRPTLQMSEPSRFPFSTRAPMQTLRGWVKDEAIESLAINGQPVRLSPDGRFETVMALRPGTNVVRVVAEDVAGNVLRDDSMEIVRETSNSVLATILPEDGTQVRVPRIEVKLEARRDLRVATIDGLNALDPRNLKTVKRTVPLKIRGDNVINIEVEDTTGEVQKTFVTVRYWPFPSWMDVPDPDDLDEVTGLPRVIRRVSDGSEMVLVPATEFLVGNPNDTSKKSRSQPARRVRISRPYYIDRFELSNRFYAAFLTQSNHVAPPHWGEEAVMPAGRGDYPAVGISWDDAMAYATWAEVDLPTEAEWELAAKGRTHQSYPWGTAMRERCANFDLSGTDTGRRRDQFLDYLDPVQANDESICTSPFGAVQMAGNAWEWCKDRYVEKAYATIRDGEIDPFTAWSSRSQQRVIRGGSWYNLAKYIRTTWRRGERRDLTDPATTSITARFVRRIRTEDLPPR